LNSLKAVADAYTKLFKEVDAEWKAGLEARKRRRTAPPTSLANADRERCGNFCMLRGRRSSCHGRSGNDIARKPRRTAPFRNRIEALNWTHAGAPARAMALVDRSNPGNSHVLKRGNPSNPGEEVPRHFLEILSRTDLHLLRMKRRLELAARLPSRENPLTARVYVNRVWLHHFGEDW